MNFSDDWDTQAIPTAEQVEAWDLSDGLFGVMAEMGRLIELMPWDERHDKVEDFLIAGRFIPEDLPPNMLMFLVGVFVEAHMFRLQKELIVEALSK